MRKKLAKILRINEHAGRLGWGILSFAFIFKLCNGNKKEKVVLKFDVRHQKCQKVRLCSSRGNTRSLLFKMLLVILLLFTNWDISFFFLGLSSPTVEGSRGMFFIWPASLFLKQ